MTDHKRMCEMLLGVRGKYLWTRQEAVALIEAQAARIAELDELDFQSGKYEGELKRDIEICRSVIRGLEKNSADRAAEIKALKERLYKAVDFAKFIQEPMTQPVDTAAKP